MKAYILRSPLLPVMTIGRGTRGRSASVIGNSCKDIMTDDLAIRRKRLLYQANHRGTQESDLVVGGFARRHLDQFDAAELDRFEALISVPDADLMDWMAGRAAPPPEHQTPVLDLMIAFKNSLLSD